MTTELAVLAFDGCFGTSVTGPIDIFNIANIHQRVCREKTASPLFSWKIYSQDGKPVRTSTGVSVAVNGDYSQIGNPDICFVPGIDHAYGNEVVRKINELRVSIGELVKREHAKGATLASVCSGSFVLADTGLLNNREATTSWWLAHHFTEAFPQVNLQLEKIVTEDNNIFCSGAVTAYMHLCIAMIEKFAGSQMAQTCAKTILLQSKSSSQAPYIPVSHHLRQQDDMVQQAVQWMQQNLAQEFQLEDLADKLAVSPRTFIRRFNQATGKPPKQYFQKLRINEAKRLLESTILSVDDITEKVGYLDVSSFRRLFKREVALSPTEYRKRFGRYTATAEA
ncbi:MAG: GlxA family transcriptional regulator [Pseudomonadota bacterium]